MEQAQRSKTAEGAAAIRAAHLLYDEPVVFEDPFAIQLTSQSWRVVCSSRFLHWLVFKRILGVLRPVRGQVVGRARYAEDALERAIVAGIRQYVSVGAGLDSFALRRKDLETTLRVYELDHPASQRAKRARLAALNLDLPRNLEFISIDFEKESLSQALSSSSHSTRERSFFSWLGTTPYLTKDAILRTLESIRSVCAFESEVVFDYVIAKRLLAPDELKVLEELERFTRQRGEPLIEKDFDPEILPSEVSRLGFDLLENLSPAGQMARYFADRSDGLCPMPGSYFAHFRARG